MPRTGNRTRKTKTKPGKHMSTPAPESTQERPTFIPANLLAALEKIETTGAVPVMITRLLEIFLTEQGRFRDDMTPAEAWQELNLIVSAAGKPKPPAAS